MIFEQKHEESSDLAFLMTELKRFVAIRNQMGGALYWNIVNDDCIKLAQKCIELGVVRADIKELFN